jgi:hypothetical protein
MAKNTKIGIVTAAGYLEAEKYYGRLHGLLEAVAVSEALTPKQKQNLIVMGMSASLPFNPFGYYPPTLHPITDKQSDPRRRRIQLPLQVFPQLPAPP